APEMTRGLLWMFACSELWAALQGLPRPTALAGLAFTRRTSPTAGTAELHLERLAGHFLPGLLLLGGQNGIDLFLRLLLQIRQLLLSFGARAAAASRARLLPGLLCVVIDRLDLFLLLVGDLEGLLDLGVGVGASPLLLQ